MRSQALILAAAMMAAPASAIPTAPPGEPSCLAELASHSIGAVRDIPVIGLAPAFVIRVTLGQVGIRLPEVTVTAEYPGEPWRRGYEERRRSTSGSFRDLSQFAGRQPASLDDWFSSLPGAQMGARGLRVNRCPRLGVWIDGMHVTAPGLTSAMALNQLSAHNIAAIELFRMSQQPSRYSDPQREDCTLLIWTRSR